MRACSRARLGSRASQLSVKSSPSTFRVNSASYLKASSHHGCVSYRSVPPFWPRVLVLQQRSASLAGSICLSFASPASASCCCWCFIYHFESISLLNHAFRSSAHNEIPSDAAVQYFHFSLTRRVFSHKRSVNKQEPLWGLRVTSQCSRVWKKYLWAEDLGHLRVPYFCERVREQLSPQAGLAESVWERERFSLCDVALVLTLGIMSCNRHRGPARRRFPFRTRGADVAPFTSSILPPLR